MDDLTITLDGTPTSLVDVLKYLDDRADPSRLTTLSDTPSDYAGQRGRFLAVNAAEDGTEFVDPPAAGAMTGAEIIAAINAELGNTDWQKAGGEDGRTLGPVEFIDLAPVSEPAPPAEGCRLYYDDSVSEKAKALEIRYPNGAFRRIYTARAKS